MIINPSTRAHLLEPAPYSRALTIDFGLVGEVIPDPRESRRVWTLDAAYAPLRSRRVRGVRFRAYDQLGFVSFIEQLQLEVLLGIGEPGERCQWAGILYPHPDDIDSFFGFVMDDEDMADDMHSIELAARQGIDVLPPGSFVERKLHKDHGEDFIEGWTLVWDGDPETGVSPDIRIETVCTRWHRAEQRRVRWKEELAATSQSCGGQEFDYQAWKRAHPDKASRASSARAVRSRSLSTTR